MIIIYHNRDMDGFASGAICKLKYPDARLIGWDYVDDIPDFEQFKDEEVIMIDITFPLDKLKELGEICSQLTVIDHHISFKKQYDEDSTAWDKFLYLYKDGIAACEIGWKYLFSDKPIPPSLELIGRYDTWRQKEGDWEGQTLPFKYFMYGSCNSAENFPQSVFDNSQEFRDKGVVIGRSIMKYEDTMNESIAKKNAFEIEAYGHKALAINYFPFSSETLKSLFNPDKHEVLVGFVYTGTKWSISLRSIGDMDVSAIAKARGGGGHKNAAGFEVKNFEDIFK